MKMEDFEMELLRRFSKQGLVKNFVSGHRISY